ncbi:MAG TPA: CoA ester lyase [Burkholderiaceae bacterium]|nr:CoA ester lyase [Burkholderiaceae bacterium]
MPARSYLYVPADRPDRYAKALAAGADAVIVDLEDAVAPDAKASARRALADWLAAGVPGGAVTVRINAPATPWFDDDLRACAAPGVVAVMVPKAERAEVLAEVAARLPGRRLLPLVETARGIADLRAVASAPAVERLAFGSIDLSLDLGVADEHEALLYARSRMVLASRLADLAAPIDGVTTALDDAEAIGRDAERARRLGFGAKLCIHPRQVAVVNRAFAPSEAELDWARRVLAAAREAGGAAASLDGKMIDRPVILRAEALLREADDAGRRAARPAAGV